MARGGRGKKSKRNGKDIGLPNAKIKKLSVSKIKPTDSIVPIAANLTHPAEATSSNFALNRNGGVSLVKEKERLSGFIFMCSSSTKPDCYQFRVFGLPMGKMDAVEKIKPGTKLFLFDFELKLLYGIYEATSSGQLNMEPAAFSGKFPVQVKFRIFKECLPLPESSLRHVIKENYKGSKFKQELNEQQVRNLLSSFHPLSTISSKLAPPTLSNKPLPLAMPCAITEDQFMYTSRLPALDNQYIAGLQYGRAPPLVRSQILPNMSFPRHVGQRTATYVGHTQPNSDNQGLPVSSNYYVANAEEPHSNYYVANAEEPHSNYYVANAEEPHSNYYFTNAEEPYTPEGVAHHFRDRYSRYWTMPETAHHVHGTGISHDQVTSLGGEHQQLSLQSRVPYRGSVSSSYIPTHVQPQVSVPSTLQGSYSHSSNYSTTLQGGSSLSSNYYTRVRWTSR